MDALAGEKAGLAHLPDGYAPLLTPTHHLHNANVQMNKTTSMALHCSCYLGMLALQGKASEQLSASGSVTCMARDMPCRLLACHDYHSQMGAAGIWQPTCLPG